MTNYTQYSVSLFFTSVSSLHTLVYQEFLEKNWSELINKVKAVDRIIDDLSLTGEMAANVRVEKTDQAKMRKLLEYTTSKTAARHLVDALYKHAADVMEDMEAFKILPN